MAKKVPPKASWLQTNAIRVTRVHFAYIAIYMVAIIIYDSWNLFPHTAISSRWTLAGGLLVLNTAIWYTSRIKFSGDTIYLLLVLVLITADLVFAAFNVSWERGLASKAVALFTVPIISAATLRSRSTLLATASLATAVYSTVTVRYFNQHYGESYRVELYGYVAFYCAMFFVLSWLLWIIIRPTKENI